MKTTAWGATVLLALAAIVAAPVAATGSAPTCQGQPATLVGAPDIQKVTGTPGSDVIVSNGSPLVEAGAGDDLVCGTGSKPDPSGNFGGLVYDAGDGNDTIDTTGEVAGVRLLVALGSGDDRFVGGECDDIVGAGDVGHDDISTGAGDDTVLSSSESGLDDDRIDLGAGDDSATFQYAVATSTQVTGGDGVDSINGPGQRDGDWVFDNVLGQARREGVVRLSWSGIEGLRPDNSGASLGSVAFVGGAASENFILDQTPLAGASLGAGDDALLLFTADLSPGQPVRAGQGSDVLWAVPVDRGGTHVEKIRLSLERSVLRYVADDGTSTGVRASGFEDAQVAAPRVRLSGDSGDNRLWWSGCRVAVAGGGGDDTVRWRSAGSGCGSAARIQVYGNLGDDHLTGSPQTDHLIGGPGDDRVDGKRRRDYCQGEWTRDCEVIVR